MLEIKEKEIKILEEKLNQLNNGKEIISNDEFEKKLLSFIK